MPDYVNHHDYDLHLVGPNGKKIHIRRGSTARLPSFFDRYVKKGFLKHLRTPTRDQNVLLKPKRYRPPRSAAIRKARTKLQQLAEAGAAANSQQADQINDRKRTNKAVRRVNKSRVRQTKVKMVGRGHRQGATDSLHKTLNTNFYPISNGVGVGILSFNRPKSLRRLVNSIIANTNLQQTTIFISDDGSSDSALATYLGKLERTNNFVILKNKHRLGIAGNANRLLRCLQRFPHKILLNDDVEVMKSGWDVFYSKAMVSTKYHHFCYHQPGVYGASQPVKVKTTDRVLTVVDTRPHGAVMTMDHKAFTKIGYFDEDFGYYGMEHVDWSSRVAAAGLQPPGYWDVDGSGNYFKIHSDRSAVPDRVKHLQSARAKYKGLAGRKKYIEPSSESEVPCISCVIPFRDIGRHNAIVTVFDNIRAQRFPHIEMILSEQDTESHFTHEELQCTTHILVRAPGKPFNKSKAFNAGVARVSYPKLLLHDADTLAPAQYVSVIYDTLDRCDGCHFGARVIYAGKESTSIIVKKKKIDKTVTADKIVTYFEGGSIACRTRAFWQIGAFVEGYWGYGCEDCDFYLRLSKGSRWFENRIVDFIHLYHSRTLGWVKLHDANKEFEAQLAALSVQERIIKQHKYFKNGPFSKFYKPSPG